MGDIPERQHTERLHDDEILHRIALKRSWIDEEDETRFNPVAFELRKEKNGENEDGLSVNYNCSIEWILENVDLKMHGIASADIQAVRQIGLDVIPDPPPDTHGLIIGVPHHDDDEKRALDLEYKLAEIFTVVWDKRKK